MAGKRPATIAEYIEAAPAAGRPHLRKLYAILKSVAPDAEEVIKWGSPFFVEPRFLFSFSAHKAHCNLAPSPETLTVFAERLRDHRTTKHYLQIPYDQPIPERLVREIAEYRARVLSERDDDRFW